LPVPIYHHRESKNTRVVSEHVTAFGYKCLAFTGDELYNGRISHFPLDNGGLYACYFWRVNMFGYTVW